MTDVITDRERTTDLRALREEVREMSEMLKRLVDALLPKERKTAVEQVIADMQGMSTEEMLDAIDKLAAEREPK